MRVLEGVSFEDSVSSLMRIFCDPIFSFAHLVPFAICIKGTGDVATESLKGDLSIPHRDGIT